MTKSNNLTPFVCSSKCCNLGGPGFESRPYLVFLDMKMTSKLIFLNFVFPHSSGLTLKELIYFICYIAKNSLEGARFEPTTFESVCDGLCFFSPCLLSLILEEPSFNPCYPIRAVRGKTWWAACLQSSKLRFYCSEQSVTYKGHLKLSGRHGLYILIQIQIWFPSTTFSHLARRALTKYNV